MMNIFFGLNILVLVLVMACILVMIAMGIDLAFGWRKAKLRGEAHSSYAFSRTFSKFLLYEGMMVISGCIDILIHLAIYTFGYIYYVPVVACIIAIILCVTEGWSMREKADAKTRNRINNAVELLQKTCSRDQIVGMMTDALQNAEKEKKDNINNK
jgi:hypothetical protein